jgi:hypothetical protein
MKILVNTSAIATYPPVRGDPVKIHANINVSNVPIVL